VDNLDRIQRLTTDLIELNDKLNELRGKNSHQAGKIAALTQTVFRLSPKSLESLDLKVPDPVKHTLEKLVEWYERPSTLVLGEIIREAKALLKSYESLIAESKKSP
jgi:hypothetical protein